MTANKTFINLTDRGNYTFFKKYEDILDPSDNIYVIVDQDFLVIYEEVQAKTKLIQYQTEWPIEAARWIPDTIKNKFWKKASQGGLPRGVLHFEEHVGGEHLDIGRGVAVGGEDIPGYMLTNLSRKCPILEWDYQGLNIPDPWITDGGFFEILEEAYQAYLAAKV